MPNPDPGLMKKFRVKKKYNFFFKKGFIKNVQVTEEAFRSQKRTSTTSKHEISEFSFLLLWVIFALLDPDPNSDPDLQPC
jgi:hypothetical protein